MDSPSSMHSDSSVSGDDRKIQLSGLYYPNKFALLYLQALEEVMGKNGINAILNLAGLSHYINNYPPDNLDKGTGIDFAEFGRFDRSINALAVLIQYNHSSASSY